MSDNKTDWHKLLELGKLDGKPECWHQYEWQIDDNDVYQSRTEVCKRCGDRRGYIFIGKRPKLPFDPHYTDAAQLQTVYQERTRNEGSA